MKQRYLGGLRKTKRVFQNNKGKGRIPEISGSMCNTELSQSMVCAGYYKLFGITGMKYCSEK